MHFIGFFLVFENFIDFLLNFSEFVGDDCGDVAGKLFDQLSSMIPRDSVGRGLTNIFSSRELESLAGDLISKNSHDFVAVNSETGGINGALAGNEMFNMGGETNSLSSIGKIVLDNIVSGKFKRECHVYVPLSCQPIYFHEERQKCLDEKRLFEDPQFPGEKTVQIIVNLTNKKSQKKSTCSFPANNSSIYVKVRPKDHIVWKRPGELFANPRLIGSDKTHFDVKLGRLENRWFLSGAANLSLRDELFYRVVPPDQSFTEKYAGIFHFQFWRYGEWVDVVIDDRLPTVNGTLCYMSSPGGSEFWGPLLEKAYAK